MANAHGLSDEAVKTIILKTAEWTADELPAEEVDQDEFVQQQARRLAVQLERDLDRLRFEWMVLDYTMLRRIENGLDLLFMFDLPNNEVVREAMIEKYEESVAVYANEIFNSLTVGV